MHRIARTRVLAAALLLATASAAGCKDDEENKAEARKAAPAPAPTPDVAGANAAVPDDLAGKISFVAGTDEDDRLAVLVPEGWTGSSAIPDRYKPGDDLGLGFMTSYSVGTNCDGACAPKDWEAAAAETEFDQFEADSFEILEDGPLEGGGRLLVAETDDRAFVVAARWKEGASRYAFCRASLDGRATEALDAFVHACRSFQVTSW
jgi:hypothetical protein